MGNDAQTEGQSGDQTPRASFTSFVATLRLQALVCLGELPNPATQKQEADLGQAKYLIDTLQIVQEKTKGNLDETEQKLLDTILYEARMRYVEACAAAQGPAGEE